MVLYVQCLEARRRVLGPTDSDTLVSMNGIGVLLNEAGVWHESIPMFKEVLRLHNEELKAHPVSKYGASLPAVVSANLAVALYMSGDQASAERLVAEQEPISAKLFGKDNPFTDQFRSVSVRLLCEQNRLEEAIVKGREVLARRRKIYAPEHPLTGNALLDLGRALTLQGEFVEGEQMESQALAIYKKSPSQSEYYPAWAEQWRGAALTGLSRWSEAEAMLVSAEQKLRTVPMTPPRHYRESLKSLVKLYEAWNKPAEAAKWQGVLAKYDIDHGETLTPKTK